MTFISKDALQRIRERYPEGASVELMKINYPYNETINTRGGTVRAVDCIGTIHVILDPGSSLEVVYGKDACKVMKEE